MLNLKKLKISPLHCAMNEEIIFLKNSLCDVLFGIANNISYSKKIYNFYLLFKFV